MQLSANLERLARAGIDLKILNIFEKNGLNTFEKLISKNEIDLVKQYDIPLFHVRSILDTIYLLIAPKEKNVYELRKDFMPDQNTSTTRPLHCLPTRMAAIDGQLFGGISMNSLTEIVGPSGSGKTAFCLMLAYSCTLDQKYDGLGSSVLWFTPNAANNFQSKRLLEMTSLKFVEEFTPPKNPNNQQFLIAQKEVLDSVASRVKVIPVEYATELLESLQKLSNGFEITRNKIKLIVIDSLSPIVSLSNVSAQQSIDRQTFLTSLSDSLKLLSTSFGCATVVVNELTNENNNSNTVTSSVISSTHLTPAHGIHWYNSVNTRLSLEIQKNSIQPEESFNRLTIAKSSFSSVVTFSFKLDQSGYHLLPTETNPYVEENPSNYWNPVSTTLTIGNSNNSIRNQRHFVVVNKQQRQQGRIFQQE